MDRPSEEELDALNQAAGSGDREAVERLLKAHESELHAFVRLRAGAMLRARESSADLVQSVYREVLEHADRFRHPSEGAFKRWLFTTALRKIKNRHAYYMAGKRDVLRNEMTPVDDDAAKRLLEHYRTFSTPSGTFMAREQLEQVEGAFDSLSDEQREVITLAHMVGLSRAEIAEQMGKSEGAVRVLLHRALAKVSGLLSDDEE